MALIYARDLGAAMCLARIPAQNELKTLGRRQPVLTAALFIDQITTSGNENNKTKFVEIVYLWRKGFMKF